MLSNCPGGARIGPKIPDWMSNNLAGREKKVDRHHFILNLFNTCMLRNHFRGDQMLMKDTTAHSVQWSSFQGGDN